MPINFHDKTNQNTYSSRKADPTWIETVGKEIDLRGKRVLDIGCGGGIYSRALADMGAAYVTGLDFSRELLAAADRASEGYPQIEFVHGNAYETGREEEAYDLVLERAVIHHLDQLPAAFAECFRVLRPGGFCLIQDRTPEDCLLPGSSTHIRGYFFEKFPALAEKEISRRYNSAAVHSALKKAGFFSVKEISLWEIRKKYKDISALRDDLLKRTGRSILHELNDSELAGLVWHIESRLPDAGEIIEEDRWTIWLAVK
ncbi:methyltransferase domain-containing protein [Bacillus infantis]|uniref:methyltransferase domain-containing protein n=1 Tax=Bacillus infantis TaxID=324767 RepID=UPI001CD28458|nr:class I SAM-dependent methyltransferase [Bacillus infantis]MCA1040436.1 methyltransferase domain-containing protein [Bacillus infantis]